MGVIVGGRVIKSGVDIMAYLDDTMDKVRQDKKMVTGIIIGSDARRYLSTSCQEVMGQKANPDETVNKYRGALLIEDGQNPFRVEVVYAKAPTMPVEGDLFSRLRKVQ